MKHTLCKYGMKKGAEKFPLMLVLSFSYVCNARCPNCPYNNSKIRGTYKDARFMSWPVFKKIADEAGKYGAVLRLTGGGEPFLHPNIRDWVAYAKSKGCKISIITNGSRPILRVVDVADVIEVSVDAGNAKDYAKARPGLSWNMLRWNLSLAAERAKKTKIIVSIINQKGINVKQAVKYWTPKVDKVQVRKYLTWGYNKNKSADASSYLPSDNIPCPWLFERMNIDSRGDVTYCGEDIAFGWKFDNIMGKSIKSIWLGKEFTEVRTMHMEGNKKYCRPCVGCPDHKYRTWTYNYFKLVEDANSNKSA